MSVIELHNQINANGNQITGLGTPTNNTDAATKQYVDGIAQGLDIKASVVTASAENENVTLNGPQTVGGVAVVAGNRVLVKNQSTASENGIYEVKAGAWTRATDATGGNLTFGAFTFVEGGTNKGRGYVYSEVNTWTQFSESTVLSAGTGITVSGQTISINPEWTGQTAITQLGTISTGTWQGSVIGVQYGGTGAANLATGFVKANGTEPFTSVSTIPVTAIDGRKLTGTLTFEHSTGAAVVKTIDTTSLDSTLRASANVQLRDSAGNVVLAGVKVEANQVAVTVTNNGASDIVLSYTVLV